MKFNRAVFPLVVIAMLILSASIAFAGDFAWIDDFNIRAEADRDGFRAQLSARFNIGKAQVKVVLGNVDSPADAYMVLRLGEMASKPVGDVLDVYKSEKSKGWGVMAKNLGIKPGSSDFHALKLGSDLYHNAGKTKGKKNNKRKG